MAENRNIKKNCGQIMIVCPYCKKKVLMNWNCPICKNRILYDIDKKGIRKNPHKE